MKSESLKELGAALAKAQAEMTGAKKDSNNPFYKSKYADLSVVWETIRAPLTKQGLCIIQTTDLIEKGMILKTILLHASGEWISSIYPIEPVKRDPQGYGSAITYARRYALMAIVGVAPEDDDGNAASAKHRVIIDQQPGPQDGIHHEHEYFIPYGPLAKMTIAKAHANPEAIKKLDNFLQEIVDKSEQLKKPIPDWGRELIEQVDLYRKEQV